MKNLARKILARFGYFLQDSFTRFRAVANGQVGQVMAGPLFLKVKTKYKVPFYKNK